MSNDKPLQGKRALVTGASRGIGAAVARLLAEAGASVVLTARSAAQIEDLAEELRHAGHAARAIGCDVADPEQIDELRRQSLAWLGGIDILVNNAGVASSAPLARTTLEEWNRLFAINATGVFLCTQAFLPAMTEAGWGRVVNIASVAGKIGAPYISAYAASKHAVIGFTRSIALEVAKRGVTVNAVCPGYVDTPMTAASVDNIVAKTGQAADSARAILEKQSPQGRLYTSEEVAYQVLMLCDPRAGGINGQSIVLDGGGVQP
jgi:NAD(P)-dependent dehydrogenase (short-subunit alcohol dehydrogenase family)